MKTMTILIGMTLWAAGNDAIAADNSDSLILENQVLRMEICRTPVPYVQRLVHKDSGRVVVSGLGSRNLFAITSRFSMWTRRGRLSSNSGKTDSGPSSSCRACTTRIGTRAATAARLPPAQKYLASYVIDENTGKPKEYVLNESNPAGDWKRHSYQFCVGAPQTKLFFCDVIDQAHAIGVDVLQMDQTVSGAGDACYCTTHGHAPGVGLYQSREFWELLDAMREHGKGCTPDFVLFHEEPHEQLIPHLDGFHVREYYEKRWYRGYPGAIGIPLFSYLYHEFAVGYGGDSAGLSRDNSRWNVRCHAMNLVAGRTPGGAIWSARTEHVRRAPGPDHDDPQPLPPAEDTGERLPHARHDAAPLRTRRAASRGRHSGPARRQMGPRRRTDTGHPHQFLASRRTAGSDICW